ncbi:MAG: acetyl-CoA carboxylase biotin carboxylase subunit [Anaerolineae bacterium]|nr:acetyl-CoA carboxylase biotin carboxylase subunit [Anaerolineae bacterium]
MFKKLLVANRGEIAVRILRACRELGVETVAVYSDADRNALHVRYADEAYNIGPAPARESYLRIDKMIEVALRAKANAIHPGYGFLAENAQFARAVTAAGIVFVGPPASAIHAMGNKVEARRLALQVGAPVVPGVYDTLSDEAILAAANEIGYPVMIKAAAGGGGKGMRRVDSAQELPNALARAHSEALQAFGDDSVYIEKALTGVRHVEFQVLADNKGNVIHLGERECSLQRRHQKLVEEAPSVVVDEALRERMGNAAVKIAQAANYVNAGTLEFLVDRDSNFYFLEMNTRLQVEHPVTELVTGVDIVKEKIRIASGRPLSHRQENIIIRGWAIECRITAEDPFNNFMPSIGKIASLNEPTGPGVRLETGLYEGMEVSLFYDPLIAKLVVWGETRAAAIVRMRRALSEFNIMGVSTSIPFHQRIMESTNFMGGHFDTNFVQDKMVMAHGGMPEKERIAAIVGALLTHERRQTALTIPPTSGTNGSAWRRQGWRN